MYFDCNLSICLSKLAKDYMTNSWKSRQQVHKFSRGAHQLKQTKDANDKREGKVDDSGDADAAMRDMSV